MRHNPEGRPALFDEAALIARRERSWGLGFAGGADFLHREVAGIVAERLAEITRTFRDVAILGAGSGDLVRALSAEDRMIRAYDISPARAGSCGGERNNIALLYCIDVHATLIVFHRKFGDHFIDGAIDNSEY